MPFQLSNNNYLYEDTFLFIFLKYFHAAFAESNDIYLIQGGFYFNNECAMAHGAIRFLKLLARRACHLPEIA